MGQACSNFIHRRFPKGGLARNASILAGGTALAQALAIAASPILTRVYNPNDFGTFQVFISLLTLALVAAGGRYDVAILLPEDEQSAIDVLGLSVSCVCLTTALATVGVFLLHECWVLPASVSVIKGYLWILPISVAFGGLYQSLSYWIIRQNGYKQIATTKLTQAGAQVLTQLGIGFASHGALGLLIGDATGRIIASSRFLLDSARKYPRQILAIRMSRMLQLAARYRDYPLLSLWGALVNTSGLALPALFLAQYYGARETGWFALVNRVLGAPGALIGNSIAQVYTVEAAKLSRSDPKRLMNIFRKTTRRMLYLGLAPCILFAILAPWLFQTVFGHGWREAGVYARFLALMFYASFVNSPVTMTLNILERQKAQFLWDGSRLVLLVLAMVLPSHFGYDARITILAYASVMTLMYAIHWTQSYFAIRDLATRSIGSQPPAKPVVA